ncbi:sulfite exporter TauE/SafE family protein [Cohnella hashimotonis]|uniref:Probable membrane transporter protein n=1 Tax=Cohnella hashimotonis TaxID=2826895 RepID=A0ABT6TN10_9BACL|nr:sulfite exporter TauE/SafE family protein [Cohnella hashimotonis]MDI4648243.1 sulfite exporter TauE/SafE family protein [Cohnella hashimotonis]
MSTAILVLIGIVAALFGSIVGLGGGIIIVPSLVLLGPSLLGEEVSSQTAVGTSLAVLIFTALTSTWTYRKQGKVDFRSGWLFFATSGPAAMIGALVTDYIPQGPFQLAFGLFMLAMFGLMLARERMKPLRIDWPIKRSFTDGAGTVSEYGYNLPLALSIGFAVGLCSGLFGIGGGSLFVPIMVILFRFPPHVATASSMFVIFLSSILGSTVHLWNGNIDWPLFLALAPGALIGGRVGAAIASRLSGPQLMWLLRVTLLIMAGYLIFKGASEM